LQQIFLT